MWPKSKVAMPLVVQPELMHGLPSSRLGSTFLRKQYTHVVLARDGVET